MADLFQTCKDWQENGDGSQLMCDICHGGGSEEEEEKEVDDVDFNDVSNIEFPNDADDANDERDESSNNIIPWREVPLMKWQRVIKTLKINTVNGAAVILTLQTRKGSIYQAWATKIISEKITMKEKEKDSKKKKNLFIKSMGKKDCKNSKKFYYDFRCKIM